MWGDGRVASHPLGCVSAGLGCSLELEGTRGRREEELEGDRRQSLDFQDPSLVGGSQRPGISGEGKGRGGISAK